MLKIIILAALLAGCMPRTSDGEAKAIEPALYIDRETGCHYLVPLGYTSTDSGITARIAADGKTHMGCKGGAK